MTRITRPQRTAFLKARAGLGWLVGSAFASWGAGSSWAQNYAIQELPPLPGYALSFGCGMNDAGAVVGLSSTGGPIGRATRWVDGVPEDLGTLPAWSRAIPLDITSDGTRIVGEAFKSGVWVPFIWENGVLTELPSPPGVTAAGGFQVNDAGVIVGRAYNLSPTTGRACRWENPGGGWVLTVLAPMAGQPHAMAWGVNRAGSIAGASVALPNWSTSQAVRWEGGPPGVPPGLENRPTTLTGLNDRGQASGELEIAPGGAWHAMYYDGRGFVDLGTLAYPNSYAYRINNRGTIAGQSYADGLDPTAFPFDGKRAILWRGGTMTAVNDLIPPGSGWDVKQLWDLNESDQATGYGRFNGVWRACLLTPSCYPDCDTSTGVGVLDIFDFLCFGNRYDQRDPYACDCDTSTGMGVCDVFDFLCFQNAYAAGCP